MRRWYCLLSEGMRMGVRICCVAWTGLHDQRRIVQGDPIVHVFWTSRPSVEIWSLRKCRHDLDAITCPSPFKGGRGGGVGCHLSAEPCLMRWGVHTRASGTHTRAKLRTDEVIEFKGTSSWPSDPAQDCVGRPRRLFFALTELPFLSKLPEEASTGTLSTRPPADGEVQRQHNSRRRLTRQERRNGSYS